MLRNTNDILPVQIERIPQELQSRDRWVLWKPDPSPNDPTILTKTPYDCRVTTSRASHSAPATWRPFQDAVEAYKNREQNGAGGIMIALGDGLAGIDLDEAVDQETGLPTTEAQAIIDRFHSYTEYSVSGKGIRIFCLAPEGPGKRSGKVEVYSQKRFLTVTGHQVPGTPNAVEDRAAEFGRLLDEIEEQRAATRKANASRGTKTPYAGPPAEGVTVLGITDDEIIMRAIEVIGDRFKALWEGDTSAYEGDASRADMALAGDLAFMCGPGEHERVEKLMRASGLVRPKWDRPDYLSERTISRAFEGRDDFYNWGVLPGFERKRRGSAAGGGVGSPASGSDSGGSCEADARPVVVIGTDTDATLTQLEHILAPVLYQRAGRLVEIIDKDGVSEKADSRRCHHGKVIAFSSVEQVQRLMSRHARFVVENGRGVDTDGHDSSVEALEPTQWRRRTGGLKEVAAPKHLAQVFAKCEQWAHIPKLNGLMQCPYLGPDGAVVSTPGYDRGSGYCLLDTGVEWLPVPEEPSPADVAKAVDLLMDLVGDFPFDGPESRSSWLAGLLTVVARPAIDGPVPMLWVDANRRGTGKSKLGRLIGIIATGCNPTELSWTGDEQEMEKRIAALLSSGSNFAQFDNVAGSLRNPILERFLTASVFDFRRFHRQELSSLPNRTTLAVTGNNLTLRGDLGRRVIRCRLLTSIECPEARDDFKYADIEAYARAHQPELLAAALTILRAHAVAGFGARTVKVAAKDGTVTEGPARPVGSFEQWDRCVRHAMLRAGLADPVTTQDEARQEDDDECKLEAFLKEVHALRRYGTWTVNGLLNEVFHLEHGEWCSHEPLQGLASAIRELTDTAPGKMPEPKILGYRLKEARDKPLGGYCLRRGTRTNLGVRYAVTHDDDTVLE